MLTVGIVPVHDFYVIGHLKFEIPIVLRQATHSGTSHGDGTNR